MNSQPLLLHEEITLLGIRDQSGKVESDYLSFAIAGAILAELLMEGRIGTEAGKEQLVEVRKNGRTESGLLDEVLEMLQGATKRAPLKTWVSRIGAMKELRHKAARELCRKGILREEEDKILLIFSRKLYPEVDPKPEREIVERLRRAIFNDGEVDARTAVLTSLANGAGLLAGKFGRKEMKARKRRIEQIVAGESTGAATKEVIAGIQTAVVMAAIIPAIVASTASGGH